MQINKIFIEKVQRRKILGLEIPFQSAGQLLSFILFSTLGTALLGLIIKMVSGKDFPFVVFCGILMIFPLMYSTLPLRMTITCLPQKSNYWLSKIEENVILLGYHDCYISNNAITRHRLKHPSLLRVRENEFEIYREKSSIPGEVVVIGPASMIEQLKIKLTALEK